MIRLDFMFLLAVDIIFLYALLRLDERMTDLEKKTGHERPKDRDKRMKYKEKEKQLKQKDKQDKPVERRDK